MSDYTNMILVESVWEVGGGDFFGWYAKGHHDPSAFLSAVAENIDYSLSDEEYQSTQVVHERWRTLPHKYGSLFQRVKPGASTRGSFLVTYVGYNFSR